jgi:hypothetical protein
MFRNKTLATIIVAVLTLALVQPAMAQFGFFGGGGQSGSSWSNQQSWFGQGQHEGQHEGQHNPSWNWQDYVKPIIPNYEPHQPYQPYQPNYQPYQPNYQPYQPAEQQPQANIVPVQVVTPLENLNSMPFETVTQKTLDALHEQTQEQIHKLIKELGDIVGNDPALAEELDHVQHAADDGSLTVDMLAGLVDSFASHVDQEHQQQASALFYNLQGLSQLNQALLKGVPGLNPAQLAKRINIFFAINIPGVFIININVVIAPWWWPGPGPWVGPNPWWWWNGPPQNAWWQPYPIGPAAPAPNASQSPVTSGVLLLNKATSPINYTVNGRSYTMQPAYRQVLPAGRTWTVAFQRGGSFGTARYGLQEGSYKFAVSDRGWELYRMTFSATLDNTSNTNAFNYVLNNQRESLPAGQSRQLTSIYPLYVKFNNGAGAVQERMLESGVYKVAASGGALDIYPAESVVLPTTAAEMGQQAAEQRINLFENPESVTPQLFEQSQVAGRTVPPRTVNQPSGPTLFAPSG